MRRPLYLSTTLPYVNADPHIGFALEIVRADIYARDRKLKGDEVFFNTGTDEHGQKIYRRALEEGADPQEYVDAYAAKFRALRNPLGLSDDLHFIRTTDPAHKAAAQEMWRRCGRDIYKKKYRGLYCAGDEMFLKESDLVNGRCPNHPNLAPEEVEEENYFFRLSSYQAGIERYLSREGVIVPEWRRQEALAFVRAGLEDLSVSREKSRLPWGVPVPGDGEQVMYVWFDALTNYISTLGWPEDRKGDFKKYWEEGEVMQIAGKDQVRFQSVIWQAMLMAAGIKNTDRVLYDGFITSGGQKMSKSLGNVIDPVALAREYGTDALRLFLARHVSAFEDTDVTMERFKEAYNADLANGLGNLVSRILTMATRYDARAIAYPRAIAEFSIYPEHAERYLAAIERFDLPLALAEVWGAIAWADSYIAQRQPYKVFATDPERARRDVAYLLVALYEIALMLRPFIPGTSRNIQEAVSSHSQLEKLFPRKD